MRSRRGGEEGRRGGGGGGGEKVVAIARPGFHHRGRHKSGGRKRRRHYYFRITNCAKWRKPGLLTSALRHWEADVSPNSFELLRRYNNSRATEVTRTRDTRARARARTYRNPFITQIFILFFCVSQR